MVFFGVRTFFCNKFNKIPVSILILKRCKRYEDVLFINASDHFEKGKRQNTLSEEHFDKIIETYKYRNEVPRYSKRVSMEEIEKQGYNLNISRYVNTSVEEEKIDLREVNLKLVEINKSIKEATDKHNEFLKELGLPLI